MNEQKKLGKKANQFAADYSDTLAIDSKTEFLGYQLDECQSQVIKILVDGGQVDAITMGTEAAIVLEKTPFYAESGGQVGDQGVLIGDNFEFAVTDTIKLQDAFLHRGKVTQGKLHLLMKVKAKIDQNKRHETALNHSATHLMHAALRKVLGEHVEQKGSLVDSYRLRFDFSHPVPVSQEEIFKIEKLVNKHIRANHPVTTQLASMDEAKRMGAMMLFGEKYTEEVRVLSMSDFSIELCGGTHVEKTGDIGAFKIISEQGIASGVRRIEAITGDSAIEYTQKQGWLINQLASSLKTDRSSLSEKVEQLIIKSKKQDKEIDKLKIKLSSSQSNNILDDVIMVGDIALLAIQVEVDDVKALRNFNDQVKSRLESGIIVLAAEIDGKVSLVVSITKDLIPRYHAGHLMGELAAQLGGKGGGRPDMAQGGGTNVTEVKSALSWVQQWISIQ